MIHSTEDFLIFPKKNLEIKGIAGRWGCKWPPVSRFFRVWGPDAGKRDLDFEPSPGLASGKIKRLGESLKGCHSIH